MNATTKYAIKNKCPRRLWKAMVRVYRKLSWVRCRTAMSFSGAKNTLFCPCCGTKLRHFVEGDYRGRPEFYDLSLFENVQQDIVCPACGSLPRHRILAQWGAAHMGAFLGKDILYFAPERGMTKWMDERALSYTTADLMDEDADLQIDISDTGLASGSYDVVICNHVLAHVFDFRKALAEMRRILRPDGIFLCSFPIGPSVDLVEEDPSVTTEEERLSRYGQSDHVRLFGIHADALLREAGWDVTVIDGEAYAPETLPVTGPSRYDINRLFLCRVAGQDITNERAFNGNTLAQEGGEAAAARPCQPATDEAQPCLSIVVPVYNVEKYLGRCLDSLLATPGIDMTEILLVDDGSTDSSGKIAEEYSEKYDYISCFHKRNGGLSDARNYGLSKASGKYVFFCDADDVVMPEGFEKVLRAASENGAPADTSSKENGGADSAAMRETSSENGADMILWDGAAFDENGREIACDLDLILTHCGLPQTREKMTGIEAMVRQIQDHNKVAMTAWLRAVKRKYLTENKVLFEENLIHEDELWTPHVMAGAESVLYISEKVYGYRVRDNSIMRSGKENQRRHAETMVYILDALHAYYTDRAQKNGAAKMKEASRCEDDKLRIDKKDLRVLLQNWADTYLWAIPEYEIGKYKCRKNVPRGKIVSASRTLKTKVKGILLLALGVRGYTVLFAKKKSAKKKRG